MLHRDELPPLHWPDEGDLHLTPRGELAWRVAIAIQAHGWTEERCAEALGMSLQQVRRLRNRAHLIATRLIAKDFRYCRVDGKKLAVDARADAIYCLSPSTCRSRASRSRVTVRRSYRGHWTTSRRPRRPR